MRHRRSNANDISGDLVRYLVSKRGLTQGEIASILQVDKSFISRVHKAERDFSPNQLGRLADHLKVPLGALLIAARPPSKPRTPETKQIVELCERLMLQADKITEALKLKRA